MNHSGLFWRLSFRSRCGSWLATVVVAATFMAAACSTDATTTEQIPVSGSPRVETVETNTTGSGGEGLQLYAANCEVCHGDREGLGATGGAPPHNGTGYTWHHPDAQLKDWILNGKFPGAMPSFEASLTEEQIDSILSVMRSWWTTEQRETQADVSLRYQEALDKYQ